MRMSSIYLVQVVTYSGWVGISTVLKPQHIMGECMINYIILPECSAFKVVVSIHL